MALTHKHRARISGRRYAPLRRNGAVTPSVTPKKAEKIDNNPPSVTPLRLWAVNTHMRVRARVRTTGLLTVTP
jgi:hypothetical protein